MAYELVKEQLDEATKGKAMAGLSAASGKYWEEESDAGFGDSYRDLYTKLMHTYGQYKKQRDYLPTKREELKKEWRQKLFRMLLILFIPLILSLIIKLLVILGVPLTWSMGKIPLLSILVQLPLSIVAIFFFLPAAARDFVNVSYRRKILNGERHICPEESSEINFADEEYFVHKIIAEMKAFFLRAEKEDLEHMHQHLAENGEILIANQMTDEEQSLLDYMRSMLAYPDVQARIGDLRREAGPVWVMIGFGLLVGGLGFFITFYIV